MSRLSSIFAAVWPFRSASGAGPAVAPGHDDGAAEAVSIRGGMVLRSGVAYGPLPRQRLDVHVPRGGADGPIVLFFYGGGWTSGDRATYRFAGRAFAGRGFTTVVADYRLHPEVRFPDFVEDAARAWDWVDRNLARVGGAARPIVLVGHSAGAHIAALLTYDDRYRARFAPVAPPPAGFVGLAGPYAFDPTTWPTTRDVFAPAAGAPDEARPAAFAASAAASRDVPALLLLGADDRTVARFNAQELADAVDRAGGSIRIVEYPGIGHVGLITALLPPLRWRAPVLDDVAAFVARVGADGAARGERAA